MKKVNPQKRRSPIPATKAPISRALLKANIPNPQKSSHPMAKPVPKISQKSSPLQKTSESNSPSDSTEEHQNSETLQLNGKSLSCAERNFVVEEWACRKIGHGFTHRHSSASRTAGALVQAGVAENNQRRMDKKESGKERKCRGGKRLKKGTDRKRKRIRDGADGGYGREEIKGFDGGRSKEKELGYAMIKREKTGKIKAKVGRKNKALKEWNLINEILENEKEEDNFDLELPKDNYIEDLLKVLDIKHEEQISKLRSIREDLMKHDKEGEIFAKIDGIRKFYNKPTKTRIPLVTSEGYWVDANLDRSRC